MNELISIVIPTYGGADLLPRAIDGVLNQTYKNFELFIVDDNGAQTESQINTSKVVEPYLLDNRIKYIVHDVNKNGSAARNTGVRNSHGVYVALLDDDDVYNPDFLEKQVYFLRSLSEDYAMVYCSHESFYNGEKIEEYHATVSGCLLYENLIHSIEIATTSALIRRSAFDSLNGFDESFRRHQDWEFIARLSSKYKIMANDFMGYKRYLEWRNVPVNADKAKKFRLYYLEKMKPLISSLPKEQSKAVYINNRLDIALWYLKEHKYLKFIKEYIEIKPGIMGLKFFVRRIKLILKRRKVKLV